MMRQMRFKLNFKPHSHQPQRGCSFQPSVDAQRLRCVNGQNEYNARCGGGGQTAKDAKHANGNPVLIFSWFV